MALLSPSSAHWIVRTVAEDKPIREKSRILKAWFELNRRGARRGCLSGPEVGFGSTIGFRKERAVVVAQWVCAVTRASELSTYARRWR